MKINMDIDELNGKSGCMGGYLQASILNSSVRDYRMANLCSFSRMKQKNQMLDSE